MPDVFFVSVIITESGICEQGSVAKNIETVALICNFTHAFTERCFTWACRFKRLF